MRYRGILLHLYLKGRKKNTIILIHYKWIYISFQHYDNSNIKNTYEFLRNPLSLHLLQISIITATTNFRTNILVTFLPKLKESTE